MTSDARREIGYRASVLRVPLDRLLDARASRAWSGADAMAWHPVRGVVGFTWPRSVTSDGVAAFGSVVARLSRGARALEVLVLDFSRVVAFGVDPQALQDAQRFVLGPLGARVRVRHAVLVGGEGLSQCALIGAFVGAFAGALGGARPTTVWTQHARLDAALGALRAPWRDELLGLVSSELTPLGLVSRLRAAVGVAPGASLREIAATLGIAPRTMQRELARVATSFHDEQRDVRLELAASRLLRTRDKVDAIARDVGYASPGHFLAVFRARFDVSPTAFRARHAHERAV